MKNDENAGIMLALTKSQSAIRTKETTRAEKTALGREILALPIGFIEQRTNRIEIGHKLSNARTHDETIADFFRVKRRRVGHKRTNDLHGRTSTAAVRLAPVWVCATLPVWAGASFKPTDGERMFFNESCSCFPAAFRNATLNVVQ